MNGAIGEQTAPGRNQNPGRQDQDLKRGTKHPRREKQDKDKFPTEDEPGDVDRKPEQTDPPVPGRTPVQIS